jgi:hypothetical protein
LFCGSISRINQIEESQEGISRTATTDRPRTK